jgi:DNA polymerase III subunit delta
LKFDQIISDLKNKIYYPIYFLTGEEPYFIDVISDYIEEYVLTDTEKEFNQTVVYGLETNVQSIASTSRRYPMMSNYQVVIVKEAQNVDKIEELLPYVENPLSSTLLVICYKFRKLDGRTAFAKKVGTKGVLFESKKLYDNKVGDWIENYLKQKGFTITPKASAIMADYLGNDLSKIANETGKLLINISPGTVISEAHIEQNIGISKDFNVFELQNAIGEKNVLKANQIINYFAANPKENPLVKVITILYGFFSKLLIYHQLTDKSKNQVASAIGVNPFFVGDYEKAARNYNLLKLKMIISYLREYDMKSKGFENVSTSQGELMKELLFKILHSAEPSSASPDP